MKAEFKLLDVSCTGGCNGECATLVEVEADGSLQIHPNGTGTADGDFAPICLEQCEGVLRLLVWADVNSSEPTHIIDMSGAVLPISSEQNQAEEQLCVYAKTLAKMGVSKLAMFHQIEAALNEV
jgi:hypothetical protein